VIESRDWKTLGKKHLLTLIQRDTLSVKEIELFKAVVAWGKAQPKTETPAALKEMLGDLLPHIRFPIMDSKDFAAVVLPSGLMDTPEVLALFTYFGSKATGAAPSAVIKKYKLDKRKGAAELKWNSEITGPCAIDEDGITLRSTATNGAGYASIALAEGKWEWTVNIIHARGNCMTVGVASKLDPLGSGRASGLHASGNCLDMQSGTGRSAMSSFRVPALNDGMVVRVRLDMDARTCSFNVNGEDSGVVLDTLPSPVYPAVDMRESGLEVRFGELVEGWS